MTQPLTSQDGDDSDSSDGSDRYICNDHNDSISNSDENDVIQRRYPLRASRNPRPSYVESSEEEET